MARAYSQNKPLVSIIMPVYNGEQFILESIQSVINQTYSQWELLVINDGSTDNTKNLIQTFADKRIRYFEQFNKGVSAARNLGLRHMNGDFFCFFDSDDVLSTDSIEARIDIFQKSPDTQFVDGTVEIYNNSLTKLMRVRKATFQGNPFSELLKMNAGVFFGPTWMIKKAPGVTYALNEDMKHCEDLFFYFSVSDQGNFSFTTKTILKYRTHDLSAMRNLDGLAIGYTKLVTHLISDFSAKINWPDKLILRLRTRKIMMLSFFGERQWGKGLRYFIYGSI